MLKTQFCKFIHINDLEKEQVEPDQYSIIIWDLDGTLYCMKSLKKKIIQSLFRPKNIIEVLRFFKVEGVIQKQRQSRLFDMKSYRQDYLKMQSFINSYLEHDLVLSKSLKLIKKAHKANIKQVVISEYPISDKLKTLKLDEYFESSFSCSEDMNCWKPSAMAAKFVMNEFGEQDSILVIGDRVDTDGELAKNLNLLKGE
ncbi:MAG: HAD-IA family hydrolase [Bacteriovoracaceae bacterium]|nr:HAD-IA family hydrolase [Bacteriovoracaceae bacterium]